MSLRHPPPAEGAGSRPGAPGALRRSRNPFGAMLALVVFAWLAAGSSFLHGLTPLRGLLVFGFATMGPGLALAGLLRRSSVLEYLVLAGATSIALTTLVAEAMSLSGFWHPNIGLVILAAITTVAAGVWASGQHRPETDRDPSAPPSAQRKAVSDQ